MGSAAAMRLTGRRLFLTVRRLMQQQPKMMTAEAELALASNAWPFQEAQKLLERLKRPGAAARPILFETGYGPSGLPHLGTFGEVARTSMVRHAFGLLSDHPTRLFAF